MLKTVDCIRSKWWGGYDTRYDDWWTAFRPTTSCLRGTEHESLPAEFLNERLIVKEYRGEPVVCTDRRTNLPHRIVVTRGRWVAHAATDGTLDLVVTLASNA